MVSAQSSQNYSKYTIANEEIKGPRDLIKLFNPESDMLTPPLIGGLSFTS